VEKIVDFIIFISLQSSGMGSPPSWLRQMWQHEV